jgi:MSHA type pilus biogenesis protein MshL
VSGKFQVKANRDVKITDVWVNIQETLDMFKSEDGIVRINRNAGIIYMADRPGKVAAMVRFLDSLMEALHRQVFIEAKIMEVRLKEDNSYGIDWSNVSIAFTDSGDTLTDVFSLSINGGSSIVKAGQSGFSAILDFLETQGDVSVVSNPHLSVMNGQSAVLTVGFQFPFADVDGVDRDTETGVVTYGASIKRVVLGLQLGITPHISMDGIVTLNIIPTITRIQGEEDVEIPTDSLQTQTISNPIIDLQELSTTVRVREGNSIVLAGLITQIRQANQKGLPGLRNIPGLRYFFEQVEDVMENRELVIYITPHVRKIE